MGIKDTVTKDYMKDPRIFADVFNHYIYNGRQLISPESLHPVNTTALSVPYGADGAAVPVQKFRDELMILGAMEDSSAIYLLLGAEYQTEQHFAMPVKDMLYDAIEYAAQVEAAAASHREEAKKARDVPNTSEPSAAKQISSAEFLSGFHRDDRLVPVITLVIHFSPEKWDAPRSLREMFHVQDEEILSLLPDYKINLISPFEMSDEVILKFQTSLREVLLYVKYSNDKKKLYAKINANPDFCSLDIKAARLISILTGSKFKFDKKKEVINVCLAIDEMMQDSLEEGIGIGRTEGIGIGRTEGLDAMARLTRCLLDDNRNSDLLLATEDKDFRDKLLKEYRIS